MYNPLNQAREPPTQGHDIDMNTKATAAIYIRKSSTDNRSGSNRSLSEQRHECLAAAEREGLTIVRTYEERVAIVRFFQSQATKIVGHSDLKPTTCPGIHVRALIRQGAFEPNYADTPAPSSLTDQVADLQRRVADLERRVTA